MYSVLCIRTLYLLPFMYMYMFDPLYIFVNMVFVFMGHTAYWIST